MEYPGKTVIISGAASGMGFLCGKKYAEEGANVVLTDINKEALDGYQVHPEHLKVKEFVHSVITDRCVVDFEF